MDIFELICNSIDDFDDGFENVYQMISAACDNLLEELKAQFKPD